MKNHLLMLGSMASAGFGLAGGIDATSGSFDCTKYQNRSVIKFAHECSSDTLEKTHLNETLGALDAGVGDSDVTCSGLTAHQPLPCLVALVNNLGSVALIVWERFQPPIMTVCGLHVSTHPVLGLARESKLVLWLSIGDFVNPEPLVRRANKTRKVPLDILNVVQLAGKRVVDIDDNDFPVRLAFVEKGHHAEHFHLLDLASVADLLADLAHVQRVIVTLGFRVGVCRVGVLPSLREGAVVPATQGGSVSLPHTEQVAIVSAHQM